jgi:peptide/nickel transport system ATP-binding protein
MTSDIRLEARASGEEIRARHVILEVKNLTTRFSLIQHRVTAVDGISFSVEEGEILAIVGESGCGKSVTALSILNLVSAPGRVEPDSEILFDGKNLARLSENDMATVRGNDIAMIFQEPSASFNILFKIGYQLSESLKIHKHLKKKEAFKTAVALLEKVKIPEPGRRVNDYPFQLSGGMLQRVMIAQALSCGPKLLIADEPTTALDVTIQAQILSLLKEMSVQFQMAELFITHDLALIEGFADRVMIMYAGRILEECPVSEIHEHPLHPYTVDLIAAIPRIGYFKETQTLYTIKGNVPALHDLPTGCKYSPRCRKSFDRCFKEEPPLFRVSGHTVRCWLYGERESTGELNA